MITQKELVDFDEPQIIAFEKIKSSGLAKFIKEEVLDFLRNNQENIGWTGTELQRKLGYSVLSVRPRLTELYKERLLDRFKRPNAINLTVEYAYKIK